MISLTLHLLACTALVVASIYWRIHAPEGDSIYRHMLPFTIASGFLGLVIVYGYLMEFFVASYSGAIYEVGALTRGHIAWIAVSLFLSLLPLVALTPSIGRHLLTLMVIGCLAAVPSIVSLVFRASNQQAEQDAS